VQDALNKASQGRTTITVAHRLSTIKEASCIYVMGDGELIESGTHNQLLRKADGAYAQLVNAQKLRDEETKMSNSSIAKKGGVTDSLDDAVPVPAADIDVQLRQAYEGGVDEPLGRVTTGEAGRSIASEVLSRRARLRGTAEPEYGGIYLFKRMATINKDITTTYIIGALAAMCRAFIFHLGWLHLSLISYFFLPSVRHVLPCYWNRCAAL
jgi:ATP-binding cassette subfamily B (MDR/TAP) protein 1